MIRSLSSSIKKILKPSETLSNLLEFQPSSKEDKQLWYVELLEGQIEKADSSIKELIDFTDKISVDISQI